jgi:hypothetical protein
VQPQEEELGRMYLLSTNSWSCFLVQLTLWEAYGKVVWKWAQCPVGVQSQTRHPGLVACQAIHLEKHQIIHKLLEFLQGER